MRLWKVGEIAKQTGLTVRTLHHYDEIGLLSPSHRSPAGYRLYDGDDIARLLQVLSLRQLGLSLEEVRGCLAGPGVSLPEVLDLHISRLREGIERQRKLCGRLEVLAARLRSAETVSVEDFLATMEAMNMYEKHYTEEQMRQLEERRETVGDERIRQVQEEWPRLIAEVRAEMDRGADPASEPVQRLARRWRGLVREFTGGDPGIQQSLNRMYREEPGLQARTGIDPALSEYIGRALATLPAEP